MEIELGDTVLVTFTGSSGFTIQKHFKGVVTRMPDYVNQFVMLGRRYGVKPYCHSFHTTRVVLTEKYKK